MIRLGTRTLDAGRSPVEICPAADRIGQRRGPGVDGSPHALHVRLAIRQTLRRPRPCAPAAPPPRS